METWKWTDELAGVRGKVNGNFASVTDALAGLNAALAGKAEGTALAALQTAVAKKAEQSALTALETVTAGKAELVVGSYTGDDTASRLISLGFTPKLVLVVSTHGQFNDNYRAYAGLAITGVPVQHVLSSSTLPILSIETGGFRVHYKDQGSTFYARTNLADYTYNYVALR